MSLVTRKLFRLSHVVLNVTGHQETLQIESCCFACHWSPGNSQIESCCFECHRSPGNSSDRVMFCMSPVTRKLFRLSHVVLNVTGHQETLQMSHAVLHVTGHQETLRLSHVVLNVTGHQETLQIESCFVCHRSPGNYSD